MNAKILASLYEMSYSNFHKYLIPHRTQLRKIATQTIDKAGKKITSTNYNAKQLNYIIKTVFSGELPFGYSFDGKNLTPIKNE